MTDVIPFQLRPKTEPRINSSYRNGRHRVCVIEVYDDNTINTDYSGDEYQIARYLAKAAAVIIGMSSKAPNTADRVLSAVVRSVDDVIDITVDDA